MLLVVMRGGRGKVKAGLYRDQGINLTGHAASII